MGRKQGRLDQPSAWEASWPGCLRGGMGRTSRVGVLEKCYCQTNFIKQNFPEISKEKGKGGVRGEGWGLYQKAFVAQESFGAITRQQLHTSIICNCRSCRNSPFCFFSRRSDDVCKRNPRKQLWMSPVVTSNNLFTAIIIIVG